MSAERQHALLGGRSQRCTHCKRTKPVHEFLLTGAGNRSKVCKACKYDRAKERAHDPGYDAATVALAQKFVLMPRPRYT